MVLDRSTDTPSAVRRWQLDTSADGLASKMADAYLQSWNRDAIVDLSNGQVTFCNSSNLDVFGRVFVAERGNGAVGLYEIGKGIPDTVVIPPVTVDIPRD